MLTYIYDWIENIAFYLVILVAVMQMIPQNSYQKYIRFFAGMILILMLAGPIVKVFGMTDFQSIEYQSVLQEIEEASGYMENIIGEEESGGE
ncbi:MAG: stage III sporulation protein AF [Tyzzerella sp.]|nr:stage III sporulation protein AF [Tyzzerella sp.]